MQEAYLHLIIKQYVLVYHELINFFLLPSLDFYYTIRHMIKSAMRIPLRPKQMIILQNSHIVSYNDLAERIKDEILFTRIDLVLCIVIDFNPCRQKKSPPLQAM